MPCDVLMVDNGSTDGTVDYVRSHYPEVQIVETGSNLGFGRANNIGLTKALKEGYEYVYLLNQDAWVQSDTFERLIEASRAYPEYGVLSPMQTQADGMHLDDKFVTRSIAYHQKTKPYLIEDLYFGRVGQVYETAIVMAAHWLITRKCLEMVGGFSPSFTHYGEDDNYLNRCRYWNLKVGIVPIARAVHDRADSHWSLSKENYILYYTNCIVAVSNPLAKKSLCKCVVDNLIYGLRTCNIARLRYAWRLFHERVQISANYQQSLAPTAFLLSDR